MDFNYLRGVYTALITPFKGLGLDLEAWAGLIEFQIKNNVNGLVPCGSTGEGSVLSFDERIELIRSCVKHTKSRVPVMASITSNNTEEARILASKFASLGADCLLVVTPYYNRPSSRGLIEHFKAINDSVNIPIILYNVPARTGSDLDFSTIEMLANIKNVVGIKDASSKLDRPLEIRKRLGSSFIQFSGNDDTALAFNAQGGVGCISVMSNVIPKELNKVQELCSKNDFSGAMDLYLKYAGLCSALNCDVNPVPIKYAASLIGLCTEQLRLPLVGLTIQNQNKIARIMQELNLTLEHA